MDTFGLPHEVALIDYLEANEGLLVLNHGISQYDLAAAFLGQWFHKVWPHRSNPLIVCLGIHSEEETNLLKLACSKFPIIASCGGVVWLGNETTGKDRRRLISKGGVFTASQQTWVLDLLQYRVTGALVTGVLALNAHTIPQRTSSRFICQLLIASCGSATLPYFVKAFVPDPTLLTQSLVGLERIVSLLGLLMRGSESNIILCPKAAAKITKYVDPLVAKYLRTHQLVVKLTTKMRIIHESLKTLQDKASNQVVQNQDQAVVKELGDLLLSESAASFLRTLLFLRYVAEKSKEGEYTWHFTPEANLVVNAALDRVASFAEGKSSLLEMQPRLAAVLQALEKLQCPPGSRVLVCFEDRTRARAFGAVLKYGLESVITREVFKVSIAAQSHDFFPPFVRETLTATLKAVGSLHTSEGVERDADVEEEADGSGSREFVLQWREVSLTVLADSDLSRAVLRTRPTHVILSGFSPMWLRQLQYVVARMHACVDWAFDEPNPAVKREPRAPKPPERGRRLINARVPVDERSGEATLAAPPPVAKAEPDPSEALNAARSAAELREAFRDKFASRAAAHAWVCTGAMECHMVGYESEVDALKKALVAEKTAWESLAVQRSGLFVMQKKTHAEIYDTLPTEVDKIAYLLSLNAGEGAGDLPSLSTRRGGGGVAALISTLRTNVTMPALNNAEYVAGGRNQRRRVENAAVHEILRKSGKEIIESMKTLVLVDMREMRSAVPCALWQAGIRILPLTLETADYILTHKIGVERKSIVDLSKSLANGRLLSQAQRLTAQFELPALLIELPGNKFLQNTALSPGKATTDAMLIPRLSCLTIGFPRLRLLWTSEESFTPELFKLLKRFQPDPTISDGRARARVGGAPGAIYRSAANTQNPSAVDALSYLPSFTTSTCDLVVSNFQTLKAFVLAEDAEQIAAIGAATAKEVDQFFSRSFR